MSLICFVLMGFIIRDVSAMHVDKVLIGPGSAIVWAKQEVSVQSQGKNIFFEFSLPSQVKMDTLVVNPILKDVSLFGIKYELLEERDEESLRQLAEKIRELELEIHRLEADATVCDKLIETWLGQPKDGIESPDGIIVLMDETEKRVRDLKVRKVDIIHMLEEKKIKLERLRQTYDEITGASKKHWKVTCMIDPSTINIEPGTILTVAYQFVFPDAGWNPIYLINGEPANGKIKVSLFAEIWQKFGSEWKDVELLLSTIEPVFKLEPPELPKWEIQPLDESPTRSNKALMMTEVLPSYKIKDISEGEKTGFMVYGVGRSTIAPGEKQKIAIRTFEWSTRFTHLMRPYVSPWAFLRGKISLQQGVSLPRGNGTFFLDGTYVKQEPFEFHGTEKVFFFGPDRFVSSEMLVTKQETGKQGIVRDKKSYFWEWQFRLHNDHVYPVTVRLEERRPVRKDERISVDILTLPNLPKADAENPDRWGWEFQMNPRENKVLGFAVRVLTPEDMKIDPGW